MKHIILAALLLLVSAPASAGPLETSFNPQIPEGLSFGDPVESVIKKMGDAEALVSCPTEELCHFYYPNTGLQELVIPGLYSSMGFTFKKGLLEGIFIDFSRSAHDESEAREFVLKTVIPLKAHLSRFYGQPQDWEDEEDQEAAEVRHADDPLGGAVWPFDDYAIFMNPPELDLEDEGYLRLLIDIAPAKIIDEEELPESAAELSV